LILATLSAAAACATPQNRVQTALLEAGLSPTLATCMAARLTDRLSIAQLQKLSRVQGAPGEKVSDLSAVEAVERLRRVDDPEVVATVTAAAGACALGG
jgi:hypothetical protein